MKKYILSTAVIAAVVLTGCSGKDGAVSGTSTAPTEPSTVSSQPSITAEPSQDDSHLVVGIDPAAVEVDAEITEVWGEMGAGAAEDGLKTVEALTSTADLWGGKRDYDPLVLEVLRPHMTPQTYDRMNEDIKDGHLDTFNHFLISTIEDGEFPVAGGQAIEWDDGEAAVLEFSYTTPAMTVVPGSSYEDGEDRLAFTGSIAITADKDGMTSTLIRDYTFNMLPAQSGFQVDWAAGETRFPEAGEV